MRIIWQTEPGQKTEFEQQFLREVVFAQTPHTAIFDCGALTTPAQNAVVIYSSFDGGRPQALVDYLARSPGHCLVHLSDERLRNDGRSYAGARAILRSYYDPRRPAANVFTLPLGFQSGFLNDAGSIDFDAKDTVWCFAGQIKSSRKKMLRAFTGLSPNNVHVTSQWSDPNALNGQQMAALYRGSIFAPCPSGFRNPDSFRVMESLEYGCIPVVLSFLGEDYFRFVYGDHPFIVASTWAKAAAQVRALVADPPSLRSRQERLVAWYAQFKRDLALDVADILQGAARDSLRSPQFALQQRGMRERTVRRYDWYFGSGPVRRALRWLTFVSS